MDGSVKEHTFSPQMRAYAGLEGPVVIEKDTTFSLYLLLLLCLVKFYVLPSIARPAAPYAHI